MHANQHTLNKVGIMKKRLFLCLFFIMHLSSNADEVKPKSDMLGLRTTIYMVNDIQQAKQWYTKAFGLAPYYDEPFYVGFNIRGFELGLMPTQQKSNSTDVIAYWGVEDADAAYKKLIALGAKPLNPIADVGGGIKIGAVTDPFGNPLGIIFNPLFDSE
jgi:lactoylglutathione lyase